MFFFVHFEIVLSTPTHIFNGSEQDHILLNLAREGEINLVGFVSDLIGSILARAYIRSNLQEY